MRLARGCNVEFFPSAAAAEVAGYRHCTCANRQVSHSERPSPIGRASAKPLATCRMAVFLFAAAGL
ncbi:MAG TPA: Ada metal-binding domain-containing protein [Bradyrhizobium sp.]|nr:Ada metal-binding domain-containing protein [Bradyrhizobium sp.]